MKAQKQRVAVQADQYGEEPEADHEQDEEDLARLQDWHVRFVGVYRFSMGLFVVWQLVFTTIFLFLLVYISTFNLLTNLASFLTQLPFRYKYIYIRSRIF